MCNKMVPVAYHDRLKAGVLVPERKPVQWVSSMVIVKKSNGNMRICLDPKNLNIAILREHHPMKTVEEVAAKMAGAKVFSVLGAKHSFWQIKLDEASSKLTTFNSQFGQHRWTPLAFGLKSAPRGYQRAINLMLDGLEGVEARVDDIVLWGKDSDEHERLKTVLKRTSEHNLRFNPRKCRIRVT